MLLGAGKTADYITLAMLAAAIGIASLLPAMVAYPIVSALGVALATLPFFVLAVVALLVQVVWRRISQDAALGRQTVPPVAELSS